MFEFSINYINFISKNIFKIIKSNIFNIYNLFNNKNNKILISNNILVIIIERSTTNTVIESFNKKK